MIRLYKALINTGATIEIKTNKDIMGVLFIFRYKGQEHKTPYTLEAISHDPMLIDDMLAVELVKFVKRVDVHSH
jgi:hypothetical protein